MRPLFTSAVLLALLLPLGVARASTLVAGADHSFEIHASENHSDEALPDIFLSGANVTGTTFEGSVLTAANLSGSVANDADFSNASLLLALLRGADLKGANFTSADLRGATGTRAMAKDARFAGTTTVGDDLRSRACDDGPGRSACRS